jgi:hypothetical protein
MFFPKLSERSEYYQSAIEQEVWATLASKRADFGFEDNPAELEQDWLILKAKQLVGVRSMRMKSSILF